MARLDRRIGILGGGQLGRMDILAGRAMGLEFHVFEPSTPCAAGLVADRHVARPYSDLEALEDFASRVDVVTLEFENVPRAAAEVVARAKPLRPGVQVLQVCQHRLREKLFLQSAGVPCADFGHVRTVDELGEVVDRIGLPVVLKTAAFGYDGKGQAMIDKAEDLAPAFKRLAGAEGVVVEKKIEFKRELSLIFARSVRGELAFYPLIHNEHRNHILHMSSFPAGVSAATQRQAEVIAETLAEAFVLEGLLAVEFFELEDGSLLVNEMAPRPHNSGHVTIEAAVTSQFEQHLRAVLGFALGSPAPTQCGVMLNLLGELWQPSTPDWNAWLGDKKAKLHLYDKGEARPGRKMGHLTFLGPDLANTRARAEAAFQRLSRGL